MKPSTFVRLLTPWPSGRPLCPKPLFGTQCQSRRHQELLQQRSYLAKLPLLYFEAPFLEKRIPLDPLSGIVVKLRGQRQRRIL